MAKKLYYKIGEACKKLDIQPYVLRYWETEFSALRPSKSKSGQRVYSDKDLEIIARVKELLYDEGYTIAGAKKKIDSELTTGSVKPRPAPAVRAKKTKTPAKKASPTKAKAKKKAVRLDTKPEKQVEKLRRGVGKALEEAQEILELLDAD